MVSVALVLIQAALLLLLLGSGLGIGPYITLSDTWLLWGIIQSLRFPFVMGLPHWTSSEYGFYIFMRFEYLCCRCHNMEIKYLSQMGDDWSPFLSIVYWVPAGYGSFSGCWNITEPLLLASGVLCLVYHEAEEAPFTALGGAPAIWPHGHTFWLNLQVTS